MASQISNYKCPACTAPLHYSGGSGKLECEYCGSSFEVFEIEALYAEKDAQAAQAMADELREDLKGEESAWDDSQLDHDWSGEGAEMKSYSCPSCGAELVCDINTAATCCPYCGNPSIIAGKFHGALKPDYVLPFILDKEQALQALKKHYKGKHFLPKLFTEKNTVEKIQGIYVPFWLFDCKAEGSAVFDATRTRIYRRGDEEITETDIFSVLRSGALEFAKVPVDASSKMPDDYMDSIEPFDYSKLKPYSPAYLPGYLADKFDVGEEESKSRCDNRCKNSLEAALRSTVVGYTGVIPRQSESRLNRGEVHYALIPVWLLNVRWQDKIYLFAVNGQTGKTVGTLPSVFSKAVAMFFALAGVLSLISCALVYLASL